MEKEEEEEAGREPPVWGGEDMVKIVKNTAAVSSILSSTISVLVAAVPPLSILRRTPIKETKVTSGGSGVGGRPPLFSASAYMRHIRGEFLPEERERKEYIYIYTRVFYASTSSKADSFSNLLSHLLSIQRFSKQRFSSSNR